jgi:hypothetical protein
LFSPPAHAQYDDFARISWLLPLKLYSLRWAIETIFYELKTFWSFGSYRLRSKSAIDNFVNLLSISYSFTKLVPFVDPFFADVIRKELFFAQFLDFAETRLISSDFLRDFDFLDFFAHSS